MKKQLDIFFKSNLYRQLEKGDAKNYLILFTLYVSTFLLKRINWTDPTDQVMEYMRNAMTSIVVWGASLYCFSFIADWKQLWKKTGLLLVLSAFVFGITAAFGRFMTFQSYNLVMNAYFCLFAAGKKFRSIVKCGFGTVTVMLLIAGTGELLGITAERPKPDRIIAGFSMGTIHPNNWAYLVFLAAVLFWYLFASERISFWNTVQTVVFFGGLTCVIYFVTTSRTVAALCLLFPLLGILVGRNANYKLIWVWLFLPFLCFGLTMFFCWKMEWVHETFYNTFFRTMAMRFVEGGNMLRMNGIPLIGHDFQIDPVRISLYGDEVLYIVDNSYVSYLILRGAPWMVGCLCWLAAAHVKCIRNGDWKLLTISTSFLLLGFMERPGLDAWFNLVLLYPLALPYGHLNGTEYVRENVMT